MRFSDTLTGQEIVKYEKVLRVYYNQDLDYFNKIYAKVARYYKKNSNPSKWPAHLKEKHRFVELVVTSSQAGTVIAQ